MKIIHIHVTWIYILFIRYNFSFIDDQTSFSQINNKIIREVLTSRIDIIDIMKWTMNWILIWEYIFIRN